MNHSSAKERIRKALESLDESSRTLEEENVILEAERLKVEERQKRIVYHLLANAEQRKYLVQACSDLEGFRE